MQTTPKDRTGFLVGLTLIMVMVAGAIVLIDLTIKAAILAEAAELKALIMEERTGIYGRRTEEQSGNGANHNGRRPILLLGVDDSRMETGDVQERDTRKTPARRRTSQPKAPGGTGEIPSAD